ncbi:MAG: hypothetical protein AAGA59_13970 [Actinomycetota bacterium]
MARSCLRPDDEHVAERRGYGTMDKRLPRSVVAALVMMLTVVVATPASATPPDWQQLGLDVDGDAGNDVLRGQNGVDACDGGTNAAAGGQAFGCENTVGIP